MARRVTLGWDFRTSDEAASGAIPFVGSSNGLSIDTLNVHGGAGSLKMVGDGLAQVGPASVVWDNGAPVGSTTFVRFYFQYLALPNVDSALVYISTDIDTPISVWLTTTGRLQLWNKVQPTTTQIGGNSAPLDAGRWYRVEFALKIDTATTGFAELRLEGATVATASNLNFGTTGTTNGLSFGYLPGTVAMTSWLDDLAVNDSTGTTQNTYPGNGKIVLLRPTADSAVGSGWALGTGAAISANGWQAVDNAPPIGNADGVGTGFEQLRNPNNSNNSSYDAVVQSYTAAGIGAADTINVVQAVGVVGSPSATAARTGSIGVVSNPIVTNLAFGGSGGTTFQAGSATIDTYPTGWKYVFGTASIAPSVTKGTAPVIRLTQVNNTAGKVSNVCALGIYVDYTPAPAKSLVAPARRQQQRQLTRWY